MAGGETKLVEHSASHSVGAANNSRLLFSHALAYDSSDGQQAHFAKTDKRGLQRSTLKIPHFANQTDSKLCLTSYLAKFVWSLM